jgi:hypothetical protein
MLIEEKNRAGGPKMRRSVFEHLNSQKTPKGVERKRKKDDSEPDT